MKFNLSKWQIISGVGTLLLFIMTLITYFAVGLGWTINGTTHYLTGFSGLNSLEGFKNADSTSMGKDIYGSGITIIIFSAFLLVTVVASWFVPATKMMVRLGLYIANYLLLFIIFILSIVVLAEFVQYIGKVNDAGATNLKVAPASIAFLVIFGMIWPLLVMGSLFDKVLFRAMYHMNMNSMA